MKCKYCGGDFKNKGGLRVHEKSCKRIIKHKEKIIKMYKDGWSIRRIEKEFKIGSQVIIKFLGDNKRSPSEANRLAHKLYPEKFKHSEETKNKIRKARLKYMKKHPKKTAWRKSNMSYPEKLFYDKILDLGWDKRYSIEREKSFFPYFADFAFINEMVIVEIDGSQHLLPERQISDKKKDKLLNDLGWSVIRVTVNEVKNNIDNVFNTIERILNKKGACNKQIGKLGLHGNQRNKKIYYCDCGNEKSRTAKICKRCWDRKQRKIKDRPPKEQLMKEVNESGYTQVGKKYGVSDTTIRKWLK